MKKSFILLGLILTPTLAFANPLLELASNFLDLLDLLLPAASLLAVIFFFWGLAKFIWNAGDPDRIKEGKGIMTWGVLAMFILITIWGIVGFMQATIGNNWGPVPGSLQIVLPPVQYH